ncbi:DndE family protein, partial [endosymbiont of Riftia pachyptila]|uniref:DndE family protein n=1 Tax=endosymbiont of Riftia pachyptila TaxID=54396 RepID=UPI00058685EC
NRVKLSKTATDKLRNMKGQTGVTPNILARIAIMLALKDGSSLKNAGVADSEGQELNKSVLFGDHENIYEAMINQYTNDNMINLPMQQTIASLIEVGVHKMGHIKNIPELCEL